MPTDCSRTLYVVVITAADELIAYKPYQVLKSDLRKHNTVQMVNREHNYCHRLKLNKIQDLDEIRNLLKHRDEWRHLSMDIMRAGEAALSSIDGAVRLQ